jgi:undecaprenyl-diphosphatase
MDVRAAEREREAGKVTGDPAPHRPALSETWIVGWREAGQLVLAYVGLTVVFVAIGWPAFGDDRRWALVRLDERVAEAFVERRTPTWNTLTLVGSWLAETVVKIGVTFVIVLFLLWLTHRWFDALFVAVSLILEASVFITVTYLVGRQRPDVPQLDDSPVGSSYPSGHVAAATCYIAVALVVIRHTRRTWLRVLVAVTVALIPIVVALSRMYRGMHFLSDVVAGVLLGAASLWVTWRILWAAERARRRELSRSG